MAEEGGCCFDVREGKAVVRYSVVLCCVGIKVRRCFEFRAGVIRLVVG